MKVTIILLAFCIIEASSRVNMSIKEFEEKYNILSNPAASQAQAEALKKAEDEINTENDKFKNKNATFAEKLNEFSNMPADEFEKEKQGLKMPSEADKKTCIGDRFNGLKEPSEEIKNDPINRAKLERAYDELDRSATPASYDAGSMGLTTPTKDQGTCGACTAFAASSLHEICMIKAGADVNLDLSEQYLVDCGYNGKSMDGCDGAYPHAYTEYFAKNGGKSPHEFSYPYLDRNPKLTCPSGLKFWNSGAEVTDQMYDYNCNADKMKKLVAKHGAVLGSLYASDTGFMNYAKGVFNECSSNKSNHAVVITGYGTDAATGKDYWIIKNSWGTNWGEKGFAKIERGANVCGIEKVCVVAQCSKTGAAEAAPPAPTPAPIPAILKCDISNIYHSGISGHYNLIYQEGGTTFSSKVKCENSICTPLGPGPKNACVYICGRTKC